MDASVADGDERLGKLLHACRDDRAFDLQDKARLQLQEEHHRDAVMATLARTNGPRPKVVWPCQEKEG